MYIRGLGWVSVDDSELVEPAASEAEGVEITDSIRKEIEDHVTALKSLVEAGKQKDAEAFAELLWKLACDNAANQATIVEAGGIEALVALVRSGAAPGQEQAARVLAQLAYNDATNQAAVAEAGGVEALVALLASSAAGGQEPAARALANIAYNNAANQAAIAEAGGVEALVALVTNGTADGREVAAAALVNLTCDSAPNRAAIVEAGGIAPLVALVRSGAADSQAVRALVNLDLAGYVSRLQSENASLKRRLAEEDVVDLCDGDAPPPEKKRTLRDMVDEEKDATLKRVKLEQANAAGEAEEAQDTLGYQVRFTNALQTKIDKLAALAKANGVDAAAVDAIKNRPNH